jgi:hypothetical protein
MKLSWRDRFNLIFRGQMAAVFHETDSSIAIGRGFSSELRDRYDYERADVLQDALDAWRLNPLARRIVELTTQYVVGQGISLNCKNERTMNFIKSFWNDRLNRMDIRVFELCDELTRSGNIFVLISTDSSGMSYIRCVPAADIEHIEARSNDVEQPEAFFRKATIDELDPAPYLAYDPEIDNPNEDGTFEPMMLQYTINRPIGGQWGESDLAPVLKWLSRYSAWLEDRARLNRFRNAFLFVVKSKFSSEAERIARQAALAANPPAPGSILVTDESETWDVISPKLEASDANMDGLALKKMVAAGSGIPMHFLAEPEGSTRTTAEAAGGPTFRHFEQRQKYFLWIVQDILKVVIARRSLVDRRTSKKNEIEVRGADISARDNVSLAMAASNIESVLVGLRQRELIDNDEFLRMVYRFCGEFVDIPEMIARGKAEGVQPADVVAVMPPVNPDLTPGPFPSGKGSGAVGPKAAKAAQPAQKAQGAPKAPGAGGARNSDINPDTGELKAGVTDPGQN